MQLSIDAADLQPIIERAVSAALDKYTSEIKSLMTAGSNRLKTVPEAAEYLQVCQRTVRNYADQGELIATRIGGNVRFAQSDLDAFVAASKTSCQPV